MTGDNRRTAEAMAHDLGLGRVFADVRPEQKADYVRRLHEEGKRVAMVGDSALDALHVLDDGERPFRTIAIDGRTYVCTLTPYQR